MLREQKHRASVHFLVNMLEAYYFADAKAINAVLRPAAPLQDHAGDVEEIRHPKNMLKGLCPQFDEKADAEPILTHLDLEHVLSNPETCASLRTMIAWCISVLEKYHAYYPAVSISDKFCLKDGKMSEITRNQIEAL